MSRFLLAPLCLTAALAVAACHDLTRPPDVPPDNLSAHIVDDDVMLTFNGQVQHQNSILTISAVQTWTGGLHGTIRISRVNDPTFALEGGIADLHPPAEPGSHWWCIQSDNPEIGTRYIRDIGDGQTAFDETLLTIATIQCGDILFPTVDPSGIPFEDGDFRGSVRTR